MIRKILAAAALSLAALSAHAVEGLQFGAHLVSLHLPANGYNNANPGLYVRHLPTGLTAGAYYNSERRGSAYVGHTSQWAGFDVTVGVVTGYKGSKVAPLLLVSKDVGNGWRVGMAPPAGTGGSFLLHLMKDF